jgi:formamidopyrimidine-DNA glycosylase
MKKYRHIKEKSMRFCLLHLTLLVVGSSFKRSMYPDVSGIKNTMPELPDIIVYIESLNRILSGKTLLKVRIKSPFFLRSYEPPVSHAEGRAVVGFRRIGKMIAIELQNRLFLVFHLMRSGRFQWKNPDVDIPGRIGLAAFDFKEGTLIVTEAGTRHRASLHIVGGEESLKRFDSGGIEILDTDFTTFQHALQRENHTLKRALTDQRIITGIGNAYSDEILHRARLSPLKLTSSLTGDESDRLFNACQTVLTEWTEQLRKEAGGEFPKKVTAFHERMAVHGRFGKPCPICGSPVQRIVYTENECNYCPSCQTGGRILSDRSLARILKGDWPKTLQELDGFVERIKEHKRTELP